MASTVIQCALASSTLDHRDAFSSVMKFFRDLLRLPRQEHLVRLCDVCSGHTISVCVCVCVCVLE